MRMKYVISAIVILLAICSCKKELIEDQKDYFDINNVKCIDGVLHFDSHGQFLKVMEFQKYMTKAEFEQWSKNIGFVSYLSLVEKIYNDLNDAKTTEQFLAVIENNSDIIEDVNNEIVPKVSLPVYQRLMSRDGNYYINGVAYRVCRDEIFSTEEGCLELLNNDNIYDQSYLKANNINLFRYKGEMFEKSSCSTDSYIQEKMNSEGTRKVKYQITPSFMQYESTTNSNYMECYYCVTVETHTLIKHWLTGKFVRYDNPHYIRNLTVRMYAAIQNNSIFYIGAPNFFGNSQVSIAAASTSTDCMTKVWCDNQQIGARVLYQKGGVPPANVNQPRINTAIGEVWSQGVPYDERLLMSHTCYFNPIN